MKPWIATHAASAPGTSSHTLVRVTAGCFLWLAAATTLASGVRAQEREVASIPQTPGVYVARDKKVNAITRAEVNVVTPKGRKILKAIAPIPVINGKSTVEVAGETATFTVSAPKQEFYFRLESNDQFALVKVSKKKGARLVQTWNVLPVINEIEETQDSVEIYQRQVGDDLFHAWPKQPLAPGQYAWIEYAPGKGNTQVWDFTVAP